MYSETIKPKVVKIFNGLWQKADSIISECNSVNEAVSRITRVVASETSTQSKVILSDMLYDLEKSLFEAPFFENPERRNKFRMQNLRREIMDKYQFAASDDIDYQEASRKMQAFKVGGATFVIGGIGAIGSVLVKRLSFSSLVPVPIGVLVAAALGTALTDYLAVEPRRSKKQFRQVANSYLKDVQQQLLLWFDEIENYYNKRVDEFRQTI